MKKLGNSEIEFWFFSDNYKKVDEFVSKLRKRYVPGIESVQASILW